MLNLGHLHHVKGQLQNNSELAHKLCREHPSSIFWNTPELDLDRISTNWNQTLLSWY